MFGKNKAEKPIFTETQQEKIEEIARYVADTAFSSGVEKAKSDLNDAFVRLKEKFLSSFKKLDEYVAEMDKKQQKQEWKIEQLEKEIEKLQREITSRQYQAGGYHQNSSAGQYTPPISPGVPSNSLDRQEPDYSAFISEVTEAYLAATSNTASADTRMKFKSKYGVRDFGLIDRRTSARQNIFTYDKYSFDTQDKSMFAIKLDSESNGYIVFPAFFKADEKEDFLSNGLSTFFKVNWPDRRRPVIKKPGRVKITDSGTIQNEYDILEKGELE